MSIIVSLEILLSTINMIILALLIVQFYREYEEVKSKFTIGFLAMSLALMAKTIFSAPIIRFFVFHVEYSTGVDIYRLIGDLFETIALIIFCWISCI